MLAYYLKEYSQDKYSFRIYDNVKKLTPSQIKKQTGCHSLVNLAYFALTAIPSKNVKAFDHQSAIMIAGKWELESQFHEYGICINKDGYMSVGTEKEATYDYAIGIPPVIINGRDYNKRNGGSNGWTYTGLKADGTVVLFVCTKDNKMRTDVIENLLKKKGCIHIFRWDGSWSSQGIFGSVEIKASQYRCCRSWLLVFDKNKTKNEVNEETKNETKKESNSVTVEVPVLKKGSKGASVKSLQRLLTAKGYSTYGVDGSFGNNTLAALKKYQKAVNLTVDGYCGEKTWTTLITK